VKLNEFKKTVVNEIDSRSLFGDYGSAALRTGLGSLAGKNVLSTTDQMAKDDFITKFTSRALSGLQSAINSGLVDTNTTGQATQTTAKNTDQATQTTQTTQQGTQVNPADAIAQKRIAAQKAQAAAIREPGADEGPKYNISPNKQMTIKGAGSTPKTPEQIGQEKLMAASKAAQGQMNPVSPLPAGQFAKSASNVRKQQQKTATQNAQGQMTGNVTPPATRPDNTVQMPKRNVKPRNPGKNAFGQMTQNLSKVAEGNRFDKLNYIFESILAEQDPAQGTAKQTISQYITNFFNQFMSNVPNIENSTVKNQVATLAKELEQTYAKDKGRSVLPKLADLAYSVSYANAGKEPEQEEPEQSSQTNASNKVSTATTAARGTTQNTQASTQNTKTAYQQIKGLLKGLTPEVKQQILTNLQQELGTTTKKQPAVNMSNIKGAKQGGPTPEEEAKLQQRIQQAQANQK